MCLFPQANLAKKSPAYRHGMQEFACGSCPECLRKRANVWALRSFYEVKEHKNSCMVTLTYDNFERDANGRLTGRELSPDRSLHVCKRDCQLFIKRLRKWYKKPIKYLITAEYGSRTHRAHYHALLFGVEFLDLVRYKKSKRGNWIYQSPKLSSLWNQGICTVDAVNVTSAVARYCTKYCAKDRSDDTFMLFSHGIGLSGLLRNFNGKSYFVEGREYPVPSFIWNRVIMFRNLHVTDITYKYKNRYSCTEEEFYENERMRHKFAIFRDSDFDYRYYLAYWRRKIDTLNKTRPSVYERILALPNSKYYAYKAQAFKCKAFRLESGIDIPPPRSNAVQHFYRSVESVKGMFPDEGRFIADFYDLSTYPNRYMRSVSKSFGVISCHITPNDTKILNDIDSVRKGTYKPDYSHSFDHYFYSETIQNSIPISKYSLKII